MKLKPSQATIIKKYLQIAKKNKFHPTRSQLVSAGISKDRIRNHFGNFSKLKEFVKEHYKKELKSVIDEDLFTKKRLDELDNTLKQYKRFIITTAVTGAQVHKGFLASIDNYCQTHNATLLVLLASDPASQNSKGLDNLLQNRNIVVSDVALNNNLFLSTIKLSAKHIDPITGLTRIGQRNGSFIYASPKQRLKTVANSNTKIPCALMTTGAITKPNYQTTRYMSERTGYIAENDHVMGAIIVEIENNKIFHFRQIQANKSGHFVDLGQFYTEDSVEPFTPAVFSLGDWHSGETDPTAKKAWFEIIDQLKVPKVIIHDGFNGKSINHHEEKNKVLRAQLSLINKLNLEDELREYARDLDELTERCEVVISRSNHDDFLDYYIREGKYVNDPQNYLFASKLATAMIEGKNPLQYAIETLIGVKHPEKIKWLDMDEDYKIAGIEYGAHGHKGANGARGNLRSMEHAYGLSVSGHSHVPEILRGAWSNGTSSLLKLGYNSGPSAWMHSSTLGYENGMRQIINSLNGKWHLKDES
jgi:hypothetical protein